MRVSIVGAGNVGRYIAKQLVADGHQVLIIDRDPAAIEQTAVPEAEWFLADACELELMAEAQLDTCDVAIAATGDDKANLVHSLLAKSQFGVARTVARVNDPDNEWLFGDMWGVDVAVNTPRIMSALAAEAFTVGDLVRLFRFTKGNTDLVEMTLPDDCPCVGRPVAELEWPGGAVLLALIRDGRGLAPAPDLALQGGDELLFLAPPDTEEHLRRLLAPSAAHARQGKVPPS